jgi:hypothetical protein
MSLTPLPIGEIIGFWAGAAMTLIIFSFIYKDNPVYKFGEHLFLGTALGYSLCIFYYNDIYPNAIGPLFPQEGAERNYWVLIPIVLGLFILLRMIPSLAWLSRISFAVLIGGFSGMAIPAVIAGNFLPQITATMAPIGPTWVGAINQIVLLVGVFATLIFFFFSLEHRGTVGKISRLGVFFIMVSFGASFGYTVMARVSLLIGRIQFLIHDWIMQGILGRGV